jgi:transposase
MERVGIVYGRKIPLVVINGNLNAVQYRDRILSTVVPYVQQHKLTLQQGNARPHVGRICREYLQAQNVDPLEWPPYSPDLSPIVHLWDEIDRRIRRRPQAPQNVQQLTDTITEEWDILSQHRINTLLLSMDKRISEATLARGGHTRYYFSVFWSNHTKFE